MISGYQWFIDERCNQFATKIVNSNTNVCMLGYGEWNLRFLKPAFEVPCILLHLRRRLRQCCRYAYRQVDLDPQRATYPLEPNPLSCRYGKHCMLRDTQGAKEDTRRGERSYPPSPDADSSEHGDYRCRRCQCTKRWNTHLPAQTGSQSARQGKMG
jgi:hypothetical protein